MFDELDAISKLTVLIQRSPAPASLPLPGPRWEPLGVMLGTLERKMGQIYWQLQYENLMGEDVWERRATFRGQILGKIPEASVSTSYIY